MCSRRAESRPSSCDATRHSGNSREAKFPDTKHSGGDDYGDGEGDGSATAADDDSSDGYRHHKDDDYDDDEEEDEEEE